MPKTTIGIPILVLLLHILHALFSRTPLANPPESIKSGHYGHPPRASWWLKQSLIYFLGLLGMKACVFVIFQLLPGIAWFGDWALKWTEGNEALQITFVMFIFPVCMNALQYYIIDSFIKERQELAGARHEEDDESRQPLRRSEEDGDAEEISDEEVVGGKAEVRKSANRVKTRALAKEADPTPVPVGRGDNLYTGDGDGEGSSGGSVDSNEPLLGAKRKEAT